LPSVGHRQRDFRHFMISENSQKTAYPNAVGFLAVLVDFHGTDGDVIDTIGIGEGLQSSAVSAVLIARKRPYRD
jgi:hypothetical protein